MKNSKDNLPPDVTVSSGIGKMRALFFLLLAVMLVLAVFSFDPADASLQGSEALVRNWIGKVGASVSVSLFYLFGLATYLLALVLLLAAVRSLFFLERPERRFYLGSITLLLLGAAMLLAMNPVPFAAITDRLGLGRSGAPLQAIPGGVIGQLLAAPPVEDLMPPIPAGFLLKMIGNVGTMIVGWVFFTAGFIMIYLSDWHLMLKSLMLRVESAPDVAAGTIAAAKKQSSALLDSLAALKKRQSEPVEEPVVVPALPIATPPPGPVAPPVQPIAETPAIQSAPIPDAASMPRSIPAPAMPGERIHTGELNSADPKIEISVKGKSASPSFFQAYTLPLISMLGKGPEASGETPECILRSKFALQQTLDSFQVKGQVTDHISGPRVTRYEIVLEPGVKVEKVTAIGANIAMNLEARSIRILAPIPGKNAVGVEAPNAKSEAVFMRSVMESEAWANSNAEIPIVLGKDVSGRSVILDLAKAPHLLIAGSTGSGKSVCMNTLIMSMLFKFTPDDLRLVMVDPKVVELEDYRKLPHLITPVVNDSKKVPVALRWAVNEMERRYRVLAKAGVKNLRSFNHRPTGTVALSDENGMPIPDRLPIIVLIIDELADLMMTEAKVEVEASIARITAKGRAAGIHIVVATQRPSTNVITGVIKANLPTRIAFRVGQLVDSRVILDQKGAELLLGKGDMLYLPPGSAELERIQGAMVDDNDIKKVVEFVAAQRPQEFNHEVIAEEGEEVQEGESDNYRNPGDDDNGDDDDDELISDEFAPLVQKYSQPGDGDLMKKALEVVLSSRQASTSYLQRRLKIGYNRAAELIDEMEGRGIIGPQSAGGSKRQLLVFDEIEG